MGAQDDFGAPLTSSPVQGSWRLLLALHVSELRAGTRNVNASSRELSGKAALHFAPQALSEQTPCDRRAITWPHLQEGQGPRRQARAEYICRAHRVLHRKVTHAQQGQGCAGRLALPAAERCMRRGRQEEQRGHQQEGAALEGDWLGCKQQHKHLHADGVSGRALQAGDLNDSSQLAAADGALTRQWLKQCSSLRNTCCARRYELPQISWPTHQRGNGLRPCSDSVCQKGGPVSCCRRCLLWQLVWQVQRPAVVRLQAGSQVKVPQRWPQGRHGQAS